MSNTILTNDIIIKLSLMNLKNTLGTAKATNRNYEKRFINGIGSTVRVEIPVQYAGRTTNTISTFEDTTEQSVTLAINNVAGADISFTQQSLSRDVTDFSDNYIKPLMITISNKINIGLQQILNLGVSNAVGSPTAPLSGYNGVDNLLARMQEMALQDDEMYCGLSTQSAAGVRQGTLSLFTPVENDRLLMKGSIGMYDGFQTYVDQSILAHTTGTFPGTPLVNTNSVSGDTTLALKGFTFSQTGVLTAGDIISIAGVFDVNPVTYQSYGRLKQFTVQATVNSSAGGLTTVVISPAIISTGAYQNVSALPLANAVVTCAGISTTTPYSGGAVTYTKNVGFTKRGLTLAAPPQEPNPGAVYSKSMTDDDTGISIGMNVAYDVLTNTNLYRWDTYWGGIAFNSYCANLLASA